MSHKACCKCTIRCVANVPKGNVAKVLLGDKSEWCDRGIVDS